ncbi:MAG: nucleotidyl transferase AbiEii/AbiGii toxin family protein [Deltaproteobacteria bacterium]|nr:nucleotidyl transferase AbiEii/AbiGii toxin family protein [Deltaproteobacteria bacterium]
MSTPAVAKALAALAAVLRAERCPWYLFGAQAVLCYGRPRLTSDVDATISPRDVPKLLKALGRAGFRVAVPGFEQHLNETRVMPMLHGPTKVPVDLVLAGPGLEQQFLARAQRRRIGRISVPVISAADLVAVKVLAGRAKDLDDVAGILEAQGNDLDLGRIREVLADLEAALEQHDLLPELERLLAAARVSRSGRAPGGRRSGG